MMGLLEEFHKRRAASRHRSKLPSPSSPWTFINIIISIFCIISIIYASITSIISTITILIISFNLLPCIDQNLMNTSIIWSGAAGNYLETTRAYYDHHRWPIKQILRTNLVSSCWKSWDHLSWSFPCSNWRFTLSYLISILSYFIF